MVTCTCGYLLFTSIFDLLILISNHLLTAFMNLIYSLLKRGIIKCQLVRLSLSKFMSIYHSSLHNFYHNLSMQHVINSRFMWFHNTTRHNLLLNKLSFILYLNSDIVKCPLVRLLISKCLSIYQSNFHKFYHNLFT